TGEANGGGNSLSYDGNGLFKSTDAGTNWTSLGLAKTGSIGKVEIDPQRPERIFVAAMGSLFQDSPDRGLYRSENGGEEWEKVLFLTDSTGAIDVVINPLQPDTVYAAMWERTRRLNRRSYGGESSGIFRSTDGGDSWTELTNGIPTVGPRKGRIGLSISPSHPNVLYAIYATQTGNLEGLYKSEDHGETWNRINRNGVISVSFMWWFGKIQVDPQDPDVVYVPGLDIVKSVDGGESWFEVFTNTHVDQHAIWIHPEHPDTVWLGNDGGLFKSFTGGANYQKVAKLPITQFYTATLDPTFPDRVYGGTQDNGIMRTPSGSLNNWEILFQADGFTTVLDPMDDQFILSEFQFGSLVQSLDGGQSFAFVKPEVLEGERINWHAPLVQNPLNPRTIYYGRNRVYRSYDRASSWDIISPDLTNGNQSTNLVFGTLTSIGVSPVDTNIIYTGSDDGKVWVSENGGMDWEDISAGLPQRWITKVLPSPYERNSIYVTLSGYKYNDAQAHIFRSDNLGQSWQAVDGNLPDIPVNDLLIHHASKYLYIATDIGVFVSENQGNTWYPVGQGLPNVVVSKIMLNKAETALYAATYGRSIFKTVLDNPVYTNDTPIQTVAVNLFPNPTPGAFNVEFELEEPRNTFVSLYNPKGQMVRQLFTARLSSGEHRLNFNLQSLVVGQYIVKVELGKNVFHRPLILSR
nr:T9SS type A sorting domain-containing protein [Saprospiraceae bacterium]